MKKSKRNLLLSELELHASHSQIFTKQIEINKKTALFIIQALFSFYLANFFGRIQIKKAFPQNLLKPASKVFRNDDSLLSHFL